MPMRSLATLALLSAYLALPGCGASPQQTARRTNHAIAIAVNATDAAFAPIYAERARAALEAAASLAEYHAAVQDIEAVHTALATASAAVVYVEHLVDLWDQGGASSWTQGLACATGALHELSRVLAVAHVPIPVELTDALALVDGIIDSDGCFEHPVEEPKGGA